MSNEHGATKPFAGALHVSLGDKTACGLRNVRALDPRQAKLATCKRCLASLRKRAQR